MPVAVEGARADIAANEGLAPNYDVGELRRLGVQVDALTDDTKAALFRMEGGNGTEYWLGLHDFYVITRYNRSAMYALAVLQLSQELRRRMEPEASAPVALRGPTGALEASAWNAGR